MKQLGGLAQLEQMEFNSVGAVGHLRQGHLQGVTKNKSAITSAAPPERPEKITVNASAQCAFLIQ